MHSADTRICVGCDVKHTAKMHKNMRRSLIMQMKPALLVMRLERRGRDPFLRRGAFIFSFAFHLHTLILRLEKAVKNR